MLRNAASPTVNITGTVAAGDIAAGELKAATASAGTWFHATATGSGNAYVLDLTPNAETPANGTMIRMRANHTNTGTATVALDGGTAFVIKKYYDQLLEAGDIRSGQECILAYDATASPDVWQLLNPVGNRNYVYCAFSESSTMVWALTAAAGFPAPTAYRDGMMVAFETTVATVQGAGTLTVNVNGLGAKNVKKDNDAAVIRNDILANQVVLLVYDASQGEFWLLSPFNVLNRYALTSLSATDTSIAVDMDTPHQKMTMTGAGTRTITTSNRSSAATEVKSVSLKILNSTGGVITLSPSASWKFIGGAGGNRDIADGKTAILSLTSYGTAETDVVAAYAVQA